MDKVTEWWQNFGDHRMIVYDWIKVMNNSIIYERGQGWLYKVCCEI